MEASFPHAPGQTQASPSAEQGATRGGTDSVTGIGRSGIGDRGLGYGVPRVKPGAPDGARPANPTPTPFDLVTGHMGRIGCRLGQGWNAAALHALLETHAVEVLCAVLDLGMASLPEKQRRADVILGRKFPELYGKLPPKPSVASATNPTSTRRCPNCQTPQPVHMNPYLTNDDLPDMPVWVLTTHDCGPTGDVTVCTRDEATTHEARRRAAAGEQYWVPQRTGVQG